MTAKDISAGSPEPLGVTVTATGVNIAVFSASAAAIEFCLFDAAGDREERRVQLPERTGDVFHGHLAGVGEGARHGLRAHGPFAPAEGLRFNPAKLLLDPYATLIDRPFRLHPSMFGSLPGDRKMAADDSAPAMPKAIVHRPDRPGPAASFVPWQRTVIYELHVRGFTMRRSDIPAALRGAFAGLGHPAAIEHLVRLGVTSVEIMPAAAWIEEPHLARRNLTNYWGYNPVALMAPDPRLAPGGWDEVRATVAALAAAGIETIVDVVLNHTGEGDELGPTLSLRGLDNATYYRLVPGEMARYNDDAGCGNVLALDRPPVLRLAMDALRTWADLAGIHGFRFDLATILGRRPDGFDPAAPLLSAIAQDPVLRAMKLIAEPWDVGPGGYQLGRFPAEWGEWNDRFRDDARRFWRGDPEQLGPLATRLAGSADFLAGRRRPSRGVNFVVAHDGFTLADLVAHERKHNDANGEDNRDGTDANFSWNHGVEGSAGDESVRAARAADQRALLATLLLARGTPMLAMGAELGHSQKGNNNAYAQDNETAWIDWEAADAGLIAWTERLIAIRRYHPAFREDRFLTGEAAEGDPLPDVAWHRPDGQAMTAGDWRDAGGAALIMILRSADAEIGDRVCLALNCGFESVDIALPEPRDGNCWRLLADSAAPGALGGPLENLAVVAKGRSALVLAEAQAERPTRTAGAGRAEMLGRLAAAAGIAAEWHEVDGTHHFVGDDTKRALLAAMGLPAEHEREARRTLEQLAEERDRRPLPFALTAWAGEAACLTIPLALNLTRRPVSLSIALPDGRTLPLSVGEPDGEILPAVAVDGRAHQLWRVRLPDLPIGRYRIQREDAPGLTCALTVAPRRCYLPDSLAGGGKRSGLAAQLYAVRRDGDQGIGDFTTLGQLGELAARAGTATLAINPLHALFSGQRERASPYQPSDRRFLDPIYLDIDGLDPVGGADWGNLAGLEMIDYPGVWALKLAALERSFTAFATRPRPFRDLPAAGIGALRRFAIFEAIAETRRGEPWRSWPGGLAHADDPAVEAFAQAHPERVLFHQYLQYLCADQLAGAAARAGSGGLELGFVRDLAVGAAPDGAEAWAQPALYAKGVSVGAPPDPLAPGGQIWGLPPPIPLAMERTGCSAYADLLRTNMRHAGGLRIDHVMGLSRLFWVPDGADGRDGAYVAYPFEHLLAQVTLESAAARCFVIGEDLGTVPDGLRAALSGADVLGYRVLLLEREGVGFRPAALYPTRALACVTTHDLPTFAGWWGAVDIAEREALGQFQPGETAGALAHRDVEKAALVTALTGEGLTAEIDEAADPPASVLTGAHAYVADSPAALVVAQADDLAGETIGVNLPGTDRERPNWRRRLRTKLPDLLTTAPARAILDGLRGRIPRAANADDEPA
jgi:glycogen operon protein